MEKPECALCNPVSIWATVGICKDCTELRFFPNDEFWMEELPFYGERAQDVQIEILQYKLKEAIKRENENLTVLCDQYRKVERLQQEANAATRHHEEFRNRVREYILGKKRSVKDLWTQLNLS